MREHRSGVIVTSETLSESEPRREDCHKRSKYIRDRATVDGGIGEVKTIDHVADEEFNIQEDNG